MLKVLILIDGSNNALRAVTHAMSLSALCREPFEFHLLNVQPAIVSGNVKRFIASQEIDKYHHDAGLAALSEARKLLDAAQVNYTCHIGVGDIADNMLRFIRDLGIGQLVMGARGLSPLEGLLLGSVANEVIQVSPVPVLVVK
jgi:nucleotide-binding universal stress UspA family protein